MAIPTADARVELPIEGMDCADCANHVQHAVGALPGVRDVRVLLAAERATVNFDPARVTLDQLNAAVVAAGYRVREPAVGAEARSPGPHLGNVISWGMIGLVATVVLGAALGERLGLFDQVVERLPWWIPALGILVGGWPVFRGVIQAARGRPGDRIPVDGRVIDGQAPVDQAPITGESVPVDKAVGDPVFAATVAQAGFLKVEATQVAGDTTFARIVRLVEEAEAHKAPVQRFADRFSTYYLPSVLVIALGTFLVSRNVVSAVAVLVVACACAIVIATPVVVLASVGTAARRGLLIKGGGALEQLARIDTVVMDKTGTLTQGRPRVTDVVVLNGLAETDLFSAVASLEARSEHPLGRAIVRTAQARGIVPAEPEGFEPLPGRGLTGVVAGRAWCIGNRRLLAERAVTLDGQTESRAQALETDGKTVFFVADGNGVAGLVALADTVRPEAKAALDELHRLGVRRLLLLTGDTERVAAAIARELGVEYRAELLPEDKIEAVRALQVEGARVMMVGDGVNDAPALAQADVGVAMGVAGTAVAIEAADVALMRDDWHLVPEAIRIGRRGARTIRQNLAFTAVYNLLGLSLAALGILPPVWAAAAQSVPDMAIMLNSARLLRGPGIRHGRMQKAPGVGPLRQSLTARRLVRAEHDGRYGPQNEH